MLSRASAGLILPGCLAARRRRWGEFCSPLGLAAALNASCSGAEEGSG